MKTLLFSANVWLHLGNDTRLSYCGVERLYRGLYVIRLAMLFPVIVNDS